MTDCVEHEYGSRKAGVILVALGLTSIVPMAGLPATILLLPVIVTIVGARLCCR